jgi:hypothetical protein
MYVRTRWTVMILGALVLSLLGGPVWAGPAPQPVVVRAAIDQLEPDRLVIRGMHFGGASAPKVLLARVPLEVLSFTDEQIVAKLPMDAPAASYQLQVLVDGRTPSRTVEFTLGRRPG